ncbi:MAG: hypothetical protein RMK29_22180 [Myxococcales bacterium]|nr:hypothetical protein [Myxococcota bacterium]MDW8284424.1 hypothetical protein [Myxococcales bacterium]
MLRSFALLRLGPVSSYAGRSRSSASARAFFENMTPLPRDPGHNQGWDHNGGKNRVTFYGTYCEQLRAGQARDVDVVSCAVSTPR